MTTPRELSERLKSPVWNDETMKRWDSWRDMIIKNRGSLPRDCFESFLDGIDEERAEAATQLDSLLKERDALQARVKGLEQERNVQMLRALKATDHALRAEQERDNWCHRYNVMSQWQMAAESRALRAEQERDEAYERAAVLAESFSGAHHIAADIQSGIFPKQSAEKDAIAATIRRLAPGPEKEKRE